MLIENVDAFKVWLAKTLAPVCDAEPEALAKYIVAMVKKDKPESELKATCLDNLEVFLQSHTKSYVDKLFDALSSRSYVESGTRPGSPSAGTTSQPAVSGTDASVAASSATASTGSSGLSGPVLTTQRSLQRASDDEISDDDRDHRRRQSPGSGTRTHSSDREKEDRRRRIDSRPGNRRGTVGAMPERYSRHDRRRGNASRSPLSRMRSRSPMRSNHARDAPMASIARRDNIGPGLMQPFNPNDAVGVPPLPPPLMAGVVPSVHNDWSKTLPPTYSLPPPPFIPKARCRDFDEKGFCLRGELCSFDHGSDPVVVDDISNVLRFPGGNKSQPPSLGINLSLPVPVQLPSHHGVPQSGLGPSTIPTLASVSSLGDASVGGRNAHRPQPSLLASEPYNPEAPAIRGPNSSSGYWNGTQRPPRTKSPSVPVQPYDPVYAVPITRNVITIQRVPDVETAAAVDQPAQNRSSSSGIGFRLGARRPGRGSFRGFPNRFGPRKPYAKESSGNATLQVKNVPTAFNNIAKLNEHFAKFGSIVSIQIAFEGDPEAALVTFSSNSEAYSAYKSSEPMFNNRFIKIFWHRPASVAANSEVAGPLKEAGVSPSSSSARDSAGMPSGVQAPTGKDSSGTRLSVHERLQSELIGLGNRALPPRRESKEIVHPDDQPIPSSSHPSADATAPATRPARVFNPAALKLDNTKDNLNTLMKRKEESNKEFVKKQVELQKQRQALLQKQLDQQKAFIAKAQQLAPGTEKDELMKAIRSLDKRIADLKKELAEKPIKVDAPASKPFPSSKEEATKELLDVELELYNRQSSGLDVSELAAKLADLRRRAANMGIDASLHRGTHFTKGRGKGRPDGIARAHSVEKPRRLLVIGFKPEEKEEVITHFNAFGALEDVSYNEAVPSVVVTYAHATDAVAAANHGAEFNNKRLIMKWHRPSISQMPVSASSVGARLPSTGGSYNTAVQNNVDAAGKSSGSGDDSSDAAGTAPHDEEVDADVDEELLLAGDDEDEDDNEKRSWR